MPLNPPSAAHPMPPLCRMEPTNRKWCHTTGNPAQCSRSCIDALACSSVEVLFSTKVQLYQIWICFYSKVQHIPSASDYIKTYNVHTVDISTLPFTVSGLNRHYFSGFSFLQQIIKLKGQQERKWQMFAYGDKGYEYCEQNFCDRQKSRPQTRWYFTMNRFQKLGCRSSVNLVVVEHHISIWLIEDSVVPWLFWNNTWLHDQLQGAPTEDAAMLNVSERAQRLMYTLYSEELRKAEQPLMHLSDALLAWLSRFYDWKEREKKSCPLSSQDKVRKRII